MQVFVQAERSDPERDSMTTRSTVPGRISIRRQVSPDRPAGRARRHRAALRRRAIRQVAERLGHPGILDRRNSRPGSSHIPYYAACSLLRMFVALGAIDGLHLRLRHRRCPAATSRDGPRTDSSTSSSRSRSSGSSPSRPCSSCSSFGNALGLEATCDLRRLHLPGLEHDVQLLPLAHHPTA